MIIILVYRSDSVGSTTAPWAMLHNSPCKLPYGPIHSSHSLCHSHQRTDSAPPPTNPNHSPPHRRPHLADQRSPSSRRPAAALQVAAKRERERERERERAHEPPGLPYPPHAPQEALGPGWGRRRRWHGALHLLHLAFLRCLSHFRRRRQRALFPPPLQLLQAPQPRPRQCQRKRS
jgi:hypothetical protein